MKTNTDASQASASISGSINLFLRAKTSQIGVLYTDYFLYRRGLADDR